MAQVKHGTVTITLDDSLAPPPEAGNLTPDQVKRIPKPPRGIGLVGRQTADAIVKAGDKFTLPAGVTAAALTAACERADGIDQVIIDLEVILNRLKQGNLIFDAEAWEMLRKLNDQVKAQAKHAPELLAIFQVLIDFMTRGPRAKPDATEA